MNNFTNCPVCGEHAVDASGYCNSSVHEVYAKAKKVSTSRQVLAAKKEYTVFCGHGAMKIIA